MLGNKVRPYLLGWRTLFMLLILKPYKNVNIKGWKYFFGSFSIFRIEKGSLSLSNGSWFEQNCLLHCVDGVLSIGEKTLVNKGSMIVCMDSIHIGQNVLIADYVSIYDHDHDFGNREVFKTKPVVIKDDVWIGSHSVILKGVHIGEGSIIAAGSVVTKMVPSGELWGGVPAKFMKRIEP
ncbi:MAG: acyltransferase [Mariprofundaceae bacterium]|nr:acyltransferase [Mariprofundaceae bacterium]